MEALLSNEFVVLALDALLHVASVFVLGIIVIIACKLLSKGFVDAKLLTGLIIAGLLFAMRVFLLNNAHYLGSVDITVVMAAVGFVLFLTSLVLVYKLVAIPMFGTILSSIVIVATQLALAHYTPVLSLKLMPEGQRFAEYAGVSNEKTKLLMEQAQNFQGDRKNNIGKVLKEALATLAFWSSEDEQALLSKDLASGVEFIQERRAFMASMTEDELAEYKAAMASFMDEQGVDLTNRYSLDNLKNATPEDLQNLANFMKDMNKEYGFTDDLPEGAADDDTLPTLESIKQIAKNLQGVKIGGEGGEKFAGLLKEMVGDEDFQNEMTKVRGQIADLKANSGQLMKTFQDADLEGMKSQLESATGGNNGSNPDVPSYPGESDAGRGQKLFSQGLSSASGGAGLTSRPFESSSNQSIDKALMDLVVYEETGYYPTYTKLESQSADEPSAALAQGSNSSPLAIPDEWRNNTNNSSSSGTSQVDTTQGDQFTSPFGQAGGSGANADGDFSESSFSEAPSQADSRVDYYIPVNAKNAFPEPSPNAEKPPAEAPTPLQVQVADAPGEDMSDYFPASALSNSLTEDYVLRAPKFSEEHTHWVKVANTIKVGAWFEGTGGANKGTVFIDGIAYRSGEKIERVHNGERYLFRFDGVLDGQILITSLKRESSETTNAAN